MRKVLAATMLLLTFALGGCLESLTSSGSDTAEPAPAFYYDEFPDVPIPAEMSPDKADTFITFTSDGLKLGTMNFSGRVELPSLVNAMHGYMLRDGWTLRSTFRSARSILIFERADRMCSMYVSEGVVNTNMLIFVSPKLPDGAVQYNAPVSRAAEPLTSSDPPAGVGTSHGNVTVYPAK
ncbi:hypothetical protein FACS1894168_1610 [Deltaproteobacteria bacterium]|nr:hypothetical protein FACS1894168_1610 [Deltaproteobacteria bacterium]